MKAAKTAKGFAEAEKKLRAAQRLYEQAGAEYQTRLAEVFHQLGRLQLFQGQLTDARDSLLKSLSLREPNDLRGMATTLNNLGVVYSDLGEYQVSLDYYFQSLPYRIQIGKTEYADSMLNIAIQLRHFAQYNEALKYYERVLPIYKEIGETKGDWSGLADLLQNMGNFYLDTGKPEKATDQFLESIRLHKEGAEKRNEAIAWDSLGLAYRALGKLDLAMDAHNQALKLYQVANDQEGIAITFINQGALFEDWKQFDRGLGAYSKSLQISNRGGSLEDRGLALYGLGRIYQKLGEYTKAQSYYNDAIHALDTLRGALTLPEARRGFSTFTNPVYYSLVSVLAAQERSNEAFKVAEQFRVRTLRELLIRNVPDIKNAIPQELYASKEKAERDLSDAVRQMSSIRAELSRAPSPSLKDNDLTVRLRNAEARQSLSELDNLKLEMKISQHISRYSFPDEPIPLQMLQSRLGTDTALLEYIFGEDVDPVILLVVTAKGLHIYALPWTGRKIKAAVTAYVDVLSRSEGDHFLHTAAGQQLYQALIAPAGSDLHGISRLVISADSALHHLPFEAIVQPDTTGFLIERYEIFYVPSATLWAMFEAANDGVEPANDLLAFAVPTYPSNQQSKTEPPDLTGRDSLRALELGRLNLTPMESSRDEVESAAAYASRRSKVYIGEAATKSQFKTAGLSDFKIIHLALHASGNEDPANCLLAFYFDPQQNEPMDGLLDMKELATLSLNARLVVLSACETARGMELVGEGVQSLSQAVLLSGARSVIASDWKVDDRATAEFMNEFYNSLSNGASKAAALRSAKLKLLEGSRFAHPRYWAAFVLTGEGFSGVDIRPLPWWRSRTGICILVIAVIGVFLFYWRMRIREARSLNHLK